MIFMKLYISNSGIKRPVYGDIQDAKSSLSSARTSISTAPSGFRYASFVNNLPSTISKFISDIEKINNNVDTMERDYEIFLDEASDSFKSINEFDLKERQGIAKDIDRNTAYNISTGAMSGLIKNQSVHKSNN